MKKVLEQTFSFLTNRRQQGVQKLKYRVITKTEDATEKTGIRENVSRDFLF